MIITKSVTTANNRHRGCLVVGGKCCDMECEKKL
jgi:hypothetical protein